MSPYARYNKFTMNSEKPFDPTQDEVAMAEIAKRRLIEKNPKAVLEDAGLLFDFTEGILDDESAALIRLAADQDPDFKSQLEQKVAAIREQISADKKTWDESGAADRLNEVLDTAFLEKRLRGNEGGSSAGKFSQS